VCDPCAMTPAIGEPFEAQPARQDVWPGFGTWGQIQSRAGGLDGPRLSGPVHNVCTNRTSDAAVMFR
jgi:hypothetical protein